MDIKLQMPIKRTDFEKDQNEVAEEAKYYSEERAFYFPEQQRKLLCMTGEKRHNGGYFIFRNLDTAPRFVSGPEEHKVEEMLEHAFRKGLDNLFLVKDDPPPQDRFGDEMMSGFDADPTFDDIYYDQLKIFQRNSLAIVVSGIKNMPICSQYLKNLNEAFNGFSNFHFTTYIIDRGNNIDSRGIDKSRKDSNPFVIIPKAESKSDTSQTLKSVYNDIIDFRNSDKTGIGLRDYFNYVIHLDKEGSSNPGRVINSFLTTLPEEKRIGCRVIANEPKNIMYEFDSFEIQMQNLLWDTRLKNKNINPNKILPSWYSESRDIEFI